LAGLNAILDLKRFSYSGSSVLAYFWTTLYKFPSWTESQTITCRGRLFRGYMRIVAVKCSKAQSPTNGQVHGADFTYGAVVTFTCLKGFHLEGSMSRRCQQDGKWSGREPICVSK